MPRVIKDKGDGFFEIEKAVLQYEDYKKDKPDLIEVKGYTDRPIAVLGGGPSLPSDLLELPKDCLYISCNHHAFRLIDPDYMVFLDSPHLKSHSKEFRDLVKNPKCKRISLKEIEHTDYYCINEFPDIRVNDTGMFATWIAAYLTTGNVYLCGIGMRAKDDRTHFYDTGTGTFWGGSTFTTKLHLWKQIINLCESPNRIRAISGPLKDEL